jgi:hypothetical protein
MHAFDWKAARANERDWKKFKERVMIPVKELFERK